MRLLWGLPDTGTLKDYDMSTLPYRLNKTPHPFCGLGMLRFALVLACLSVSATARANYLSDDDVDVIGALEPAPKINSAIAKADREVSESWQERRTTQDCENVLHESRVKLQALFGAPEGPLSDAEVARLSPFMMKVKQDGSSLSELGKNHWKRLRPYLQYGNTVKLCPGLEPPGDYSYPSGHATGSRLFALVLGEIFPARRSAFLTRADHVAEDRVIAGAHFPSDIEAGKKLGDLIFAALMRNDSFREDLRKQR